LIDDAFRGRPDPDFTTRLARNLRDVAVQDAEGCGGRDGGVDASRQVEAAQATE
jgi:hypothetical protein